MISQTQEQSLYPPNIHLSTPEQFWPNACVITIIDGRVTNTSKSELELSIGAISLGQANNCVEIVIKKPLDRPLVLNHIATSNSILGTSYSIALTTQPSSCAHVMYYFSDEGTSAAQSSCEIDIDMQDSSSLCFYNIATTDLKGKNNCNISAQVNNGACLNIIDLALCHGIRECNMEVNLVDEGASFKYFALNQLNKNATTSCKLNINHLSPNTSSSQVFRGAYAHKTSGSFLGKVLIDECAHESKAEQNYKTILLSSEAKANVMPQLEVNNNDISASHGASIGELDADAIFYLRTRGLSEADAKAIMITSLSSEITDMIDCDEIKLFLQQHVNSATAAAIEPAL